MLTSLLDEKEVVNPEVLQAYFIQAVTWSLGSSLLEDGRAKFDHYLKYLSAMPLVDPATGGVAGSGPLIGN